jgi:hypothetical protein
MVWIHSAFTPAGRSGEERANPNKKSAILFRRGFVYDPVTVIARFDKEVFSCSLITVFRVAFIRDRTRFSASSSEFFATAPARLSFHLFHSMRGEPWNPS